MVGKEITSEEIGQFPAFYVLELKHGSKPFAIKVGKTSVLAKRLNDYRRSLGGNYFNILYLRRFPEKKEHGFYDNRGILKSHYAGAFESQTIRKLKEEGIKPLYIDKEWYSDEYYSPKDKLQILSIIYQFADDLSTVKDKPVPVKKSKRIQKQTQRVTRSTKGKVSSDPKVENTGNLSKYQLNTLVPDWDKRKYNNT